MGDRIDITNFMDLKSCDPQDVVARTGCEYDDAGEHYVVEIWGGKYCVDLKLFEVRTESSGSEINPHYLHLFILYFLMKSKNIQPLNEWVSEKDILGGASFFRGPHTIPVSLMTAQFGDDLVSFKTACEKLGGTPIDLADMAYTFQITSTIPVAVLYWQGDEDFPSEAKLLFDRTIEQHLPLDIIYALSVLICQSLGN